MTQLTELQTNIGQLADSLGHSKDPHIVLLFLLEELGESCRAFLKENGYKEGNNRVAETFKQELGDVFMLLLRLAYITDTDLEKELNHTIQKLKKVNIEEV